MENAQRCHANALLCRQQAVLHPEESWKWLGQAERWEHLADAALIQITDPPPLKPSRAAA
jgi:hypothetical protein